MAKISRYKFRSLDFFFLGDLVTVFMITDLNIPIRFSGFCISKDACRKSFKILSRYEVIYTIYLCNPNLIRVINLTREE